MANLKIVTTVVAQPDLHVFIPVDETIGKLKELLRKYEIVFVRAGVSSGKSTMVRYMADKMSDEFVQVESQASDSEWYRSIVKAGDGDTETIFKADDFFAAQALKNIAAAGKVILIDEAHNLFSHEAPMNLIVNRPRDWSEAERPKILLFSAAASGRMVGKAGELIINTPKEITKKVMWYPPLPDVNSLAGQLKRANVYLSGESVRLFVHFCAGRRGVFMRAMEWVLSCQAKEREPKTWERSDTIAYIKKSLESGRTADADEWRVGLLSYLGKSRAVKVNNDFSDPKNIPEEFIDILFEGSKTTTELPGLRNSVRTLTTAGFLLPERDQGDEREFIDCDWNSDITRYGVSYPVMALYYQHVFKGNGCEVIPDKKMPRSAADLTARFIPYLSFATVVDNSIPCKDGVLRSSLNSKGKPYEENYNSAIAKVLYELKYSTANPQNRNGKTDVVVVWEDKNLVALESVLAAQDEKKIKEHASRFYKKDERNYSEATFKGLLIIDDDAAKVKKAMSVAKNHIEQRVKNGGASVEVIGLLHSSTYDGFHMVLDEKKPSLLFTCDRVARSLEGDGEKHVSAQQLTKKRKLNVPA